MKSVLLITISITFLASTKSHVTNRTAKVSALNPVENEYIKDLGVKKGVEHELIKNVKRETNRVYLEDVVYSLKNQNWTDEELPCLNHTLLLLRSLQNFTLWAVWDWDSVSSQPQGILFGNRYQLGNFDECLNAPWTKTHEDLKTQYCLSEIVLERTDNAVRKRNLDPVQPYQSALDYIEHRPLHTRPLNTLTWGVCVPAHCPPRAVERLMATMLARSHLGIAGIRPRISVTEPCQKADEGRKFDGLFYAFVIMMSSLAAIALICTYLNTRKNKSETDTVKDKIIKAFCLRDNFKNLLQMKKEGVEVLYGVRFLTMVFIVMDHQVGMMNLGPISNGAQVDKDAGSILGMFVLHDDLFVDTFFLLSGFLASVAFAKFKRFPNPILLIIRRYVRIVVAFAVVIFFTSAVFPFIGSGPLWNRAIAGETEPCRRNWWLSLLMLNNYIDNENICIVVSWYIPCDFHFFVITVLVYCIYKYCPKLGLTCAGVLTVASVIVPGVINYVNELPAVQLFTYEFVTDPRGSEQFHLTYIKSHTRFTAYIVGFIAGYIFASCKATGNIKRISQKWSVLGVCAGLTIMTAVMIVGTTYLWRNYNRLESAVYAALNRPIWACGFAMLALCCSLGYVPLMKRFLEWYPWAPLSRLTYGIYLTHPIIIIRNAMVMRDAQHYDYLQLLTASGGVLLLGSIAALLIWLLAEAPANNLLVICIQPKLKSVEIAEDVASPPAQSSSFTTVATAETGHLQTSGHLQSSGHLQTNLPANVQLSSKC